MSKEPFDSEGAEDAAQRARRDFLQKAGKLAAYTPPVILALMCPGAHAIASGGGQCYHQGGHRGQNTHHHQGGHRGQNTHHHRGENW